MKEYLNNNIKKYFKEHWIGNIELGWTYYDKLIAANILNITVDSIPNNYFKAFNNQLKTHQSYKRLDIALDTRFTYYTFKSKKSDQNLQYNQLPLITLPSQEEALRLLNKDKDQTKELLLFEQKLQDVHRDDNNTLEDNITSNNRDKTATSIETTPLSTETTSLIPLDLNTKHSI
ncbi:unnamed protein product [Rhizophagus irregularis]|nr:unnamed protein product [Rhizophagus irregularis]